MMEQYQLFDELLMKPKAIRAFCEDREKMLIESVRIDIPIDGIIDWLKTVGEEIDGVVSYIDKISSNWKSHLHLME
jgi:hypothetical protein